LGSALQALQAPATPRIDISRASSSSHPDSNSRDSSPERELFAGDASAGGARLAAGFREDAADLRSSTEELDFLEGPGAAKARDLRRRRERKQAHAQAQALKEAHADGTQSERGGVGGALERKDSSGSALSAGDAAGLLGERSRGPGALARLALGLAWLGSAGWARLAGFGWLGSAGWARLAGLGWLYKITRSLLSYVPLIFIRYFMLETAREINIFMNNAELRDSGWLGCLSAGWASELSLRLSMLGWLGLAGLAAALGMAGLVWLGLGCAGRSDGWTGW
ncbi:Uncharacterized protein GBIM_19956, partial [Gryllus bimaculatus]